MGLLESSDIKNGILTVVIASIFLASFGTLAHNASADVVTATIPVGSSPGKIVANPSTDEIYVANGCCSHSVSIIDGKTDTVIDSINLGATPAGIAVNPNTNMIYVDLFQNRTFYVINGSTNQVVTTIPLQAGGLDVRLNPVTDKIYVAELFETNGNPGATQPMIQVIDGTTNTIIKTINVDNSVGIAVNPSTNKIYVNDNIIDGANDTIAGKIPGLCADFLAADPNTDKLYSTCGSSVQIVDLSTNTIVSSVLASADGVDVNPLTDKIYVSGYGSGNGNALSIINGSSNTVVQTLTVGSGPFGVAVNPSTNKIYMTNSGSNSVSVIDGNLPTIQQPLTIPVGSKPWGIGVNPNTNMIYVANSDCCVTSPTVSVINGTDNSVASTIPVFGRSSGIAVNPVTNMIYVAEGGMRVQAINGSTNSIAATIFLYGPESGNIPHEITVDPTTNLIYVTYYTTEHSGTAGGGPSRVAVINGTTNAVISTLSTMNYPNGITANPSTNKIYVAIGKYGINANSTVSVIDGSSNSVVSNIDVPNSPNFVAANPDTNRIYVTEFAGGKLAVIDGALDKMMTEIPVGSIPYGVGVDPVTNKIYVANSANNTVSVIDGLSNQVSSVLPVGSSPYEIAVNSHTGKIYVTNFGSNTVSVIDGSSSVPQPPTELTATPKMPPQIDLNWTAPSNNGGSAITGYMIERSANNGATWSMIIQNTHDTKTAYINSHLMPVKTYTYRVSAINGIGTSDPSNTASARPLSAHDRS